MYNLIYIIKTTPALCGGWSGGERGSRRQRWETSSEAFGAGRVEMIMCWNRKQKLKKWVDLRAGLRLGTDWMWGMEKRGNETRCRGDGCGSPRAGKGHFLRRDTAGGSFECGWVFGSQLGFLERQSVM